MRDTATITTGPVHPAAQTPRATSTDTRRDGQRSRPYQTEWTNNRGKVMFDPEQGSPETNDWLARAARSTVDEGLWDPPAKMLYAIRGCRTLKHPFPMTALKLRTGKHIDQGFQYSYALVRAIDDPD